MQQQVIIVYFIYIDKDSNWQKIISGQLRDLQRYGLLKFAELYIHITDTFHINTSEEYVRKICPKANISKSTKNEFEYPAIKLVSNLSLKYPNSIIGYLHTKGMSKKTPERIPVEKFITEITFKNWKQYLTIFDNENINKVGYLPSENGKYIWINFWFAKATYINTLEQPTLTQDRFYYEAWLGQTKNLNYNFLDSYCIYDPENLIGYTSYKAAEILQTAYEKKYRLYIIKKEIEKYIYRKAKALKYYWKTFLKID